MSDNEDRLVIILATFCMILLFFLSICLGENAKSSDEYRNKQVCEMRGLEYLRYECKYGDCVIRCIEVEDGEIIRERRFKR